MAPETHAQNLLGEMGWDKVKELWKEKPYDLLRLLKDFLPVSREDYKRFYKVRYLLGAQTVSFDYRAFTRVDGYIAVEYEAVAELFIEGEYTPEVIQELSAKIISGAYYLEGLSEAVDRFLPQYNQPDSEDFLSNKLKFWKYLNKLFLEVKNDLGDKFPAVPPRKVAEDISRLINAGDIIRNNFDYSKLGAKGIPFMLDPSEGFPYDEYKRSLLFMLIRHNLIDLEEYAEFDKIFFRDLAIGKLRTEDALIAFANNNSKHFTLFAETAIKYLSDYSPSALLYLAPYLVKSADIRTSMLQEYSTNIGQGNYQPFVDYLLHTKNTENTAWLIVLSGAEDYVGFPEDKKTAIRLALFRRVSQGIHIGSTAQEIKGVVGLARKEVLSIVESLAEHDSKYPISIGLELECVFNGLWATGEVTREEIEDYARLVKRQGSSGFARDAAQEIREKILSARAVMDHKILMLTSLGIQTDKVQYLLYQKGLGSHEYVTPATNNPEILIWYVQELIGLGYLDLTPEFLLSAKRVIDFNFGADREGLLLDNDAKLLQLAMLASGIISNGLKAGGAKEILDDPHIIAQVMGEQAHPKILHLLGGKPFFRQAEHPSIYDGKQNISVVENKAGEINSLVLLIEAIRLFFSLLPLLLTFQRLPDNIKSSLRDWVRESDQKDLKSAIILYKEHHQGPSHEEILALKWAYFAGQVEKIFKDNGLPSPVTGYESILTRKPDRYYNIDLTKLDASLLGVFGGLDSTGEPEPDALTRYEIAPEGSYPDKLRQLMHEVSSGT